MDWDSYLYMRFGSSKFAGLVWIFAWSSIRHFVFQELRSDI